MEEGVPEPLLILGGGDVVARSIAQALRMFGLESYYLDADSAEPNSLGALVDALLQAPLSLPVIVARKDAWAALSVAVRQPKLIFPLSSDVPVAPGRPHLADEPLWRDREGRRAVQRISVVPALFLTAATVREALNLPQVGLGNLVAGVVSTVRPATTTDRATLVRGALRLLASERHDLRIAVGTRITTHTAHDIHAARRLLQGAVICQEMDGPTGDSADANLLAAAAAAGHLPSGYDRRRSRAFFDLAQAATRSVPHARISGHQTSPGEILVVDDQLYWQVTHAQVWKSLGFRVRSAVNHEEAARVKEASTSGGVDVRVVILDLHLNGDFCHGLAVLKDLCRQWPVIVYSVDDSLSIASDLEIAGAFCYVTKSPRSEEQRHRDEAGTFCMLRDAVVLAAHASHTKDLGELWSAVRGSYKTDGADVAGLDTYVERAWEALVVGCRDTFRSLWGGAGVSTGLVARQVVRALGLANDKWCECVKRLWFDPDREDWTLTAKHAVWPLWTYHKIVNTLRNHASHATVPDSAFRWLDVWIMALAYVQKLDGFVAEPRGTLHAQREQVRARLFGGLAALFESGRWIPRLDRTADLPIRDRTIAASESMLALDEWWRLSGCGNFTVFSDSAAPFGAKMGDQWLGADARLDALPGGDESETLLASIRLAVEPYVLRPAAQCPTLSEMAKCLGSLDGRTDAQLMGDELIMRLVLARSAPVVAGAVHESEGIGHS